MADRVQERDRARTLWNLTGTQLALIGIAALAVIGVLTFALNGDESTPSIRDVEESVTTQQQQYETLLDARPRMDRLIRLGASPAVVTDAFDDLDAAQAAVADSAGGAAGYVRFLDERLTDEQAALELARTEGMASPAAVQQIQQNIADVQAEQARLAALD
jgi:hypothetical protein